MFSLSSRYERLEEQLNDLTELHQNEMSNLKQELASMEEKVAYQSYERARDIQVTTLNEECANVHVYNLKRQECPILQQSLAFNAN